MMPRRPGDDEVKAAKLEKLEHVVAFEIKEQTPPGQIFVMEKWNEMRERLLLVGEMEQK